MKPAAKFCFRLYIAGTTSNSVQAVANLQMLCRTHLPDRHEIEIIDLLRHPHRAQQDGVFVTPLLIKCGPAPACRIIGNLSQGEKVRRALGLEWPVQ